MLDLFPGFEQRRIRVGSTDFFLRCGGHGPTLLLLHGYPQTHHAWSKIAPRLAQAFHLVMPDLPGYGASTGPAPDPENLNYSKREVAKSLAGLMAELGQQRFAVVGHDRGARVGFRMALDHGDRVLGFASLDTVPTLDVWEAMDWQEAVQTFHWPFLAQGGGIPETLIAGEPRAFVGHLLERWAGDPTKLDPRAVDEYLRAFSSQSTIDASCADYRAGATVDVEHDAADRAQGRRIACPVLVIWGADYLGRGPTSPQEIWRRWAEDPQGVRLDCGHFLAEEEPAACAEAIGGFFRDLHRNSGAQRAPAKETAKKTGQARAEP